MGQKVQECLCWCKESSGRSSPLSVQMDPRNGSLSLGWAGRSRECHLTLLQPGGSCNILSVQFCIFSCFFSLSFYVRLSNVTPKISTSNTFLGFVLPGLGLRSH